GTKSVLGLGLRGQTKSYPCSGNIRPLTPFLHQPLERRMNHMSCRLLIALMAWTPFQMAHAGMIGTEQFVSSANSADRTTVLNVLSRTEVASQLQALGIDPA